MGRKCDLKSVQKEASPVQQSSFSLFLSHVFSPSLCYSPSQFEDYVMDICFEVLDNSNDALKNSEMDIEHRSDPVYVSRVITAMVTISSTRCLKQYWQFNSTRNKHLHLVFSVRVATCEPTMCSPWKLYIWCGKVLQFLPRNTLKTGIESSSLKRSCKYHDTCLTVCLTNDPHVQSCTHIVRKIRSSSHIQPWDSCSDSQL